MLKMITNVVVDGLILVTYTFDIVVKNFGLLLYMDLEK
jgi:hypothetical protein